MMIPNKTILWTVASDSTSNKLEIKLNFSWNWEEKKIEESCRLTVMISIESIRKEKPIFGLSFSPSQTFLTFSVPSVFPTTSHAFLTSYLGFKLLLLKFQSVWSELVKGNLKTILDWRKGAWSIEGVDKEEIKVNMLQNYVSLSSYEIPCQNIVTTVQQFLH